MKDKSWVSEIEASNHLCVNQDTLRNWREIGYLKEDTHWCYADPLDKQTVIYHLAWTEEEMNYWCAKDSRIMDFAA